MKDIVAVIFGFGLFVNACIFVPQIIQIWRVKSAESISLVTFGGFNVIQSVGAVHGYYQHDWALMFGMIAALMTSGSVTLLAFIYRRRSAAAARARAQG